MTDEKITFEIPDFEEEQHPVYESIPNFGIDDLEPISDIKPAVVSRRKSKKRPEVPKPTIAPEVVPTTVENPVVINYQGISEYAEYPKTPKIPSTPEVSTPIPASIPKPKKLGLWAKLVSKIPVDSTGKLSFDQPPVVIDEPIEKFDLVVEPVIAPEEPPVVPEPIVVFEPVVPEPVVVIESGIEPISAVEVIGNITPQEIAQEPELTIEVKPAHPPKNLEVKKIIRDFMTKRNPPVVEPAPEVVVKPQSYVERKYSPIVITTQLPIPAAKEPVTTDTDIDSLFEPASSAPTSDLDMRTEPLPPVIMKPKQSFLERLKTIKMFSRVSSAVKSKRRDLKTGLTARQRIKRYNSIHEGGYGIPKEAIPVKTNNNR